jgi:phenylpyruvate tautomerase PptA (4-oxalocrotonate tautomerase family)
MTRHRFRTTWDKQEVNMPLVRIDIIAGRTDSEIIVLADAVQEAMVEVFAAPVNDRYQVIHEHRPGLIRALDSGLGYPRTNKIVIIQVTQQGRTEAQKRALYNALCEKLERAGVPRTDLIISIVQNTKADWSFGLGRDQFLEGDL